MARKSRGISVTRTVINQKQVVWRVNIQASMAGKRIRRFFSEEAAAIAWADDFERDDPGRSKIRRRKTLSLPKSLVEKIQAEADLHWAGDFTRAALEGFKKDYPKEVGEFLKQNVTQKFSRKKF